jgi:hypothetical protein
MPYGWGHSFLLGRLLFHLQHEFQLLSDNSAQSISSFLHLHGAKFPGLRHLRCDSMWMPTSLLVAEKLTADEIQTVGALVLFAYASLPEELQLSSVNRKCLIHLLLYGSVR